MFDLPRGVLRRVLLLALSAFFLFAGVSHFTSTEFFVSIVPSYLPAPLALVYLSGVFEILGGLGVLLARSRRPAGLGLMALLVAVFPANLHMALHPELFPDLSPALLYARLPLQLVFVAWAWVATRPEPQSGRSYQATSQ
jgi:uncharacterized membrane protein